jgi:hypothetical protein
MSRKRSKAGPGFERASGGSRDIALIQGRTPDGEGLRILRQRDERLEVGAVKPLKEGAPITGEIVTLRPRPEFPLLCDVEVAYSPQHEAPRDVVTPDAARRGPPRVTSPRYRDNWDAIWSRSAKKSALSN